jgi:hypothetical protein
MKALLATLMIALSVTFAGCAGEDAADEATTDDATPAEVAE